MQRLLALLDRFEPIFFREGPGALRWLALSIAAAGLLAGIVISLNDVSGAGLSGQALLVAVFMAPAALVWLLSLAVQHRHAATVPLILVLCLLSAITLRGVPGAADGLSPQVPIRIGSWVVGIAEAIAICIATLFAIRLWRKRVFG